MSKYKPTVIGFQRTFNQPLEADTYFESRQLAVEYAKSNPTAFNGQRIYFKNSGGDYEERQVHDGVLLRPLQTGNGCTIVDRLSSFLPFRVSINSSVLLQESGPVYLGIGNYQAKYNDITQQFEHHGGGVGTSSFDYSTGILTVNIPLDIGKEYYIRSTFHNVLSAKGFYESGGYQDLDTSSYQSWFHSDLRIHKRFEFKAKIQTSEYDTNRAYCGGKLDIYEYTTDRKLEYPPYGIYRYAGKGKWVYSGKVTNENKVFAKQSNALVYKTDDRLFTVEYPPKPYTGVDIRSIAKVRKSSFNVTDNPNAEDQGFVKLPSVLPMMIGIFIYKKKRINNYSNVYGVKSSFRVTTTKYRFHVNIDEMFTSDYKSFIEKLMKSCRLRSREGRYAGNFYCKFYLSFYYNKVSRNGIMHYYPTGNKMHYIAYKTETEYNIKYAPDKH